MASRKLYFILFEFILISTSCSTITYNEVDLGNHYTLRINGKWKSIDPGQIYYQTEISPLITDYKFDDTFIIAKQTPDYEHYLSFLKSDYTARFGIYTNFIKDSTSKTFMNETTPFIRKAIRGDSSFYKLLKSKGVTEQNQSKDQDKIMTVIDSIFHSDIFYIRLFSSKENYWLIDKIANIRYGPFSKTEFDNECKTRNIKIRLE